MIYNIIDINTNNGSVSRQDISIIKGIKKYNMSYTDIVLFLDTDIEQDFISVYNHIISLLPTKTRFNITVANMKQSITI